jgi:DNA-binding SARP family transcriptional activator
MARTLALAAERTARSRGCLGARLLAQAALAESDPAGGEHRELVAALAEQTGLQLPRPVGHEEAAGQDAVQIRCLGSFSFARGGRDVDLSSLKPRARALLRLLAVNAGALVHREALQEALWPGAPVGAGSHNLQVAVSSLRQVLEPGVARGEHALLVRDGEAYRLALGPGSAVDFMEFENGLSRAREPAPIDARISAYRAALALYAGDLLPEDGPSEWVVGHREHLRAEAVAGQRELAELLLEAGDAGDAIEAARAGLRLDRYQDGLWKLLIEALDQYAGTGAASRARAQYRSMLSELGVTSTEPVRT